MKSFAFHGSWVLLAGEHGDYLLGDRLGSGAYGVVYKATHQQTGRRGDTGGCWAGSQKNEGEKLTRNLA